LRTETGAGTAVNAQRLDDREPVVDTCPYADGGARPVRTGTRSTPAVDYRRLLGTHSIPGQRRPCRQGAEGRHLGNAVDDDILPDDGLAVRFPAQRNLRLGR